ncbi:1047_t:CDS:10, partial [Entrophospora sp. SA101]
KIDGLIRNTDGLEYGGMEAGRYYEGEKGTKWLKESKLKLPKLSRDMLVQLDHEKKTVLEELEIVGFVHGGRSLMLIFVDIPKGYICRLTRSIVYEIPTKIMSFYKALELISAVWTAKLKVQRTISIVEQPKTKISVGIKRKKSQEEKRFNGSNTSPKRISTEQYLHIGNNFHFHPYIFFNKKVQFKQVVNDIKKELKDRMKAAKRRPVANAQSQVHSFNKSAHSEIIADHNDPYRVEWTDVDDGSTYYIGEKALRIPDTETDIKLFYPIQNGELNTKDYDSVKAVVGDLEKIWTSSQTTTVSCVEDGMCINDSRLSLHYGGDDITTFFIKLLKKNKFPYQEMNLNCVYDWLLAEEIKEKFCTLDEANLGIQLNEFFVRASNKHTLLYKSKIYDDAIIAPMVVAQVSLTQKPKIPVSSSQASQFKSSFPSPSPQSRDSPGSTTPLQIENPVPSTPSNNNVTSAINTTEQESPSLMTSLTSIHDALLVDPSSTLPLDDAIIQSINATSTDERVKRFYPNIILVGGSSLIPGLSKMLEERLRARNIQNSDKFTILASPRELDPRLLAWKGGFVLSKLDIINEFWIGSKEWAELGVRSLRAKAFFIM